MKKTLFFLVFLMPFYLNATLFITSNTTISTSTTYADEVIVGSNVVITISGVNTIVSFEQDLTISASSKLIVTDAIIKSAGRIFLKDGSFQHPTGAQLIATNTLFTAISDRWRGIEVWGDAITERCAMVEFTSSTLDKAFIGIASYSYTGPFEPLDNYNNPQFPIPDKFSPNIQYKEKRGGIIKTKNSTFKNNNTHIDLIGRESEDIINSIPINSNSSFKITSFLLEDAPYPLPYAFVELYPLVLITDISGVSILGCSFKDELYNQSTGVWSMNSDIRISRGNATIACWGNLCFSGPVKTTFNGHGIGVLIKDNSTFKRTMVENSKLENFNYYGIEGGNCMYPNLLGNFINFSNFFGISLNFSTGYEVSQNSITQMQGIGMNINESGEDLNYIYKNNLINCGIGIFANGKNKSQSLNGSGLKLICNDFTENNVDTTWDIRISPNNDNDGISAYQGDVLFSLPYVENAIVESRAAGNKFYIPKGVSSTPKNIYAEPNAFKSTYIYGNQFLNEYPAQRNIPLLTADYQNTCPNLYDQENSILAPDFPGFLYIMPKIETGISVLLEKEELTSLDSMILDGHFSKQRELVNDLIRGYLYANDSIIHYDSIALVLDRIQYGWSYKVQLAQILATQHKYEDAINTLNNIPLNYELSIADQNDLADMADMYEILEFLWLNEDNWSLVSDNMKNKVDSILQEGKGNYGLPIAQYFQLRYNPSAGAALNSSNNGFKTKIQSDDFIESLVNKSFKISPNPVLNTLEIEWITNIKNPSAMISFFNLSGKMVFKKNISATKSNLNVSSLIAGVYLVQIQQNGKIIHEQKLIKK